ncbi:MAG: hypothetical protein L7U87_08135 [Chlamydiales bacterium]|nr:hypothetical protein [Chlamydiales bacterium]
MSDSAVLAASRRHQPPPLHGDVEMALPRGAGGALRQDDLRDKVPQREDIADEKPNRCSCSYWIPHPTHILMLLSVGTSGASVYNSFLESSWTALSFSTASCVLTLSAYKFSPINGLKKVVRDLAVHVNSLADAIEGADKVASDFKVTGDQFDEIADVITRLTGRLAQQSRQLDRALTDTAKAEAKISELERLIEDLFLINDGLSKSLKFLGENDGGSSRVVAIADEMRGHIDSLSIKTRNAHLLASDGYTEGGAEMFVGHPKSTIVREDDSRHGTKEDDDEEEFRDLSIERHTVETLVEVHPEECKSIAKRSLGSVLMRGRPKRRSHMGTGSDRCVQTKPSLQSERQAALRLIKELETLLSRETRGPSISDELRELKDLHRRVSADLSVKERQNEEYAAQVEVMGEQLSTLTTLVR